MSGAWCSRIGHHFVEPLWPWQKTRCLHCGITEEAAIVGRLTRIEAELRETVEEAKARASESKAHTEEVLARSEELLSRARQAVAEEAAKPPKELSSSDASPQ